MKPWRKTAASQAPAPPKIEIMIHLASGFLKPIFETKVFHGRTILPTNRATRRRAVIVNHNKLCHLKRAISNPIEIRKKTQEVALTTFFHGDDYQNL
jgi:hypothetical protein